NWRFVLILRRYAQNLSKMALLSSDSFLCQACGIHEDLISERMWLDVRRIGLGPVSRLVVMSREQVTSLLNAPLASVKISNEVRDDLRISRVNGTAKDSNNDGGRISSGISVSIRRGIIYQETPNNYCCLAHILHRDIAEPAAEPQRSSCHQGSVRRPIEDSDDGVRLTVPLTPRSSSSSSLLALRWRDQPRNQYDFEEIESSFNKISIRGNGLKWRYHVQRAADTKATGRYR
ncbi:hypothetical protein V1478_003916, partial [Vespula squamosa]